MQQREAKHDPLAIPTINRPRTLDSQATERLRTTAARERARCAFLKDDMKTLEQIYANYKSETLDGRDLSRLCQFIPEADLPKMGLALKPEYVGKHKHIPFTRDNVLSQLSKDVAFGFEKALDKRGLSSGVMYEVVSMWNWVLEEGLESYNDDTGYAQYGLPLFKATAVKYGFDNPIGDDSGDEYKYSAEGL